MQKPEVMRPVTMYVSKVTTEEMSLKHMERPRITTLDLELTLEHAEKLYKYLQERIERNDPGSVRVRLEGHLVHG